MSWCNYYLFLFALLRTVRYSPLSASLILFRQSFIQRCFQRNTFSVCKQYPDSSGLSISKGKSSKLFVLKFSLSPDFACLSELDKTCYKAHILLALLNKTLCPRTPRRFLLLDQVIQCKKVLIFTLIDINRLLLPGIPLEDGLTVKIDAEIGEAKGKCTNDLDSPLHTPLQCVPLHKVKPLL